MVQRRIDEKHERFDCGYYNSDNPHVTQAMCAKAVGAIEVYYELLHLDCEDINE